MEDFGIVEGLELEVETEGNMEFTVGELFHSHEEFETKFECCNSKSFTEFWKRDTRIVATARRRLNHTINDNLQYYELTLCCIHRGNSFKPSRKGIRNTRQVRGLVCIILFT